MPVEPSVDWPARPSGRPTSSLHRFPLKPSPLFLEAPAIPHRFVEALGEQAGVWGSLAEDIEGWVYPFKLFDGLSLHVSTDGGKTFWPVKDRARIQTAAPHFAQLQFAHEPWAMTETLFVPRALPGFLLLLEIKTSRDIELRLRFRPVLTPMHLDVARSVVSDWDGSRGELVVKEPAREIELRVGSPLAAPAPPRGDTGTAQDLQLHVPVTAAKSGFLPIAFAATWPGGPSVEATMDALLGRTRDLFEEARLHYVRLLERAPQVKSPDAIVNDALAWSVVSLDQLRVRNPHLGCGLVSGYSASGSGTRPRYCWFFEEPTLTSWAYHRVGLSDQVREALLFLQRFQRADGKTAHEITQSLQYQPGFLKTFPYAYMHSDGPVYFLAAYGQYYRATGDHGFIRSEWPRIRKTLEWCLAAVDPADGLIRIEPGDWGSAESSIAVWKDTQLEGMWVRALREMTRLSQDVGDRDLEERCARLAERALASIENKFWDDENGNYVWGLNRQGQPLRSLVPHHAISFWLSELRQDRVVRVLEQMSSADFRTDWGVRSLSLADPGFDPASYQCGSVWPVWNAGVIISDYRHHRAVEGFRNWLAMLRLRTLAGLGPMPEVLSGRVYEKLAEGVPHQMFSEIAVQNGFYDGLLGLEVDVPVARLKLAPQLPPLWEKLSVERIQFGASGLNIDLQRKPNKFAAKIDLHGPAAELDFAPGLPAGTKIEQVLLDGKPKPFQVEELPAATKVSLQIPRFTGSHTIEIRHRDGIDFMPVDDLLKPGEASRNLRIVRAGLINTQWHADVEGLPHREYLVDFHTSRRPASISAGELLKAGPGDFRLRLRAPGDSKTSRSGFARWRVNITWAN